MSTLHLLANDGFLTVNKHLARIVGLDAAVMVAELASLYLYWEIHDGLDVDGMFYATAERIENDTTLSRYKQNKAIGILAEKGVIKTKRKGVPAMQYFAINEQNLIALLEIKSLKNFNSTLEKTSNLEFEKLELNNNREVIKEKKNKKDTSSVKHKHIRQVIPPQREWVADYCRERGNRVDSEKFYDYYESKGWLVGRTKMKDWQAAIRTWERNGYGNGGQSNNPSPYAEAWMQIKEEIGDGVNDLNKRGVGG